MQHTRRTFACVVGAFVLLIALGCASTGGLKVIDASDAKNPTFAKAKQVFSPSESPLLRVHGCGGRKVTVQIKEATRGVVGTVTRDIPKATVENTGRDIGFRSEGGQVVPVEGENVRWITTDLRIPLKPLPVGKYEIVLTADDGRTETQTFEVKGDAR
jgi:hypothetical protein